MVAELKASLDPDGIRVSWRALRWAAAISYPALLYALFTGGLTSFSPIGSDPDAVAALALEPEVCSAVDNNPWGFSLTVEPNGRRSYFVREPDRAMVEEVFDDAAEALHASQATAP